MAQVIVEMSSAGIRRSNPSLPAFTGQGGLAETVATSGTSAATTIEAEADFFASVYNADAAQIVWAVAGQNPTAAANSGFSVGPGERRDIGPLNPGDKIALIDG